MNDATYRRLNSASFFRPKSGESTTRGSILSAHRRALEEELVTAGENDTRQLNSQTPEEFSATMVSLGYTLHANGSTWISP